MDAEDAPRSVVSLDLHGGDPSSSKGSLSLSSGERVTQVVQVDTERETVTPVLLNTKSWWKTVPLAFAPSWYSYYCLFALVIVSILDQADRWALPTLQVAGLQCLSCGPVGDPFHDKCMEECLDITDTEFGLLTGPTFAVSSIIMSIVWGWLADYWYRVYILFFGLVIWSLATTFSSIVYTFWHLAILRVVLGIGQAAVNPTGYSLLSDFFRSERHSRVLSLFSAMVFTGQVIGLLTGILSQNFGWRIAFLTLGVPGLIYSVPFVLTVKEPKRGLGDIIAKSKEPTQTPSSVESEKSVSTEYGTGFYAKGVAEPQIISAVDRFLFILKSPPFIALWVSAAFRFMGGYALGSWIQVFYRRVHGMEPSTISMYMIFINPVGGLTGSLTGGWLADVWTLHAWGGKAWLCAVCSVVAAPFMVACLIVENQYVSLVMLLLEYFFAEMWFGPAVAIVQEIIPTYMRSLATAVYITAGGVGAFSPMIVGWMNDHLGSPVDVSDEETGNDPTVPLLIMVAGTYLVSAVFFTLTGLLMRRFYKRQHQRLQQPTD